MVAAESCLIISFRWIQPSTPRCTVSWQPRALSSTQSEVYRAHRKELKSQYKDFNKFLATYEVPSSLIEGIIAEGKKEKIEPKDEAELAQTKKYLAVQLKALVARDIWDMSQYFQVWNETNEIVQRAVQLRDVRGSKGRLSERVKNEK